MISTNQINLKAEDKIRNDPIAQNYDKVWWGIHAMLWLKVTEPIKGPSKYTVWRNF